MTVADLGAGTGYFSRYLAAAVGGSGSVLAVDPEPNMVAYLRARAEREHTDNVVPILASADNPRLPVGSVDVVLIGLAGSGKVAPLVTVPPTSGWRNRTGCIRAR